MNAPEKWNRGWSLSRWLNEIRLITDNLLYKATYQAFDRQQFRTTSLRNREELLRKRISNLESKWCFDKDQHVILSNFKKISRFKLLQSNFLLKVVGLVRKHLDLNSMNSTNTYVIRTTLWVDNFERLIGTTNKFTEWKQAQFI